MSLSRLSKFQRERLTVLRMAGGFSDETLTDRERTSMRALERNGLAHQDGSVWKPGALTEMAAPPAPPQRRKPVVLVVVRVEDESARDSVVAVVRRCLHENLHNDTPVEVRGEPMTASGA